MPGARWVTTTMDARAHGARPRVRWRRRSRRAPAGRLLAGRADAVDRPSEAVPTTRRARGLFWPIATQQVTRAMESFPFRDVSAAAACAGAVALWALALSLLAV